MKDEIKRRRGRRRKHEEFRMEMKLYNSICLALCIMYNVKCVMCNVNCEI
jgi:uncharacterized Fe-S cluster-containing radical SAM superfamily protein